MNRWVGLVGRGKDGRGPAAVALADGLRERGVTVGGLIHHRRDDSGHDVENLATGERTVMTVVSNDPDVCDFAFPEGIFDTCRDWLLAPPQKVTFVELGRVEAQQKGHWNAAVELMKGPETLVVCLLRPSALAGVALGLPDPTDFLELPASPEQIDAFAADVAALVA